MDNDEVNNFEGNEKILLKDIGKFIIWVAVCVLIAKIITTTIIVNGEVPSGSMENTIMTGDRFIANRFAYTFGKPERYDVVVFESPDEADKLLIKRIIGLPGDEVEIEDGELFINAELIDEPYIKEDMEGDFGPYNVPLDSYFMLGDNRSGSTDSRFWYNTYANEETIIGKAMFTYFPKVKIIN